MIFVLSALCQSKSGTQLGSWLQLSSAGLAVLCYKHKAGGWLSWAPWAALQHSRKQQGSSGCLSLDCFHVFCVCFSSPALTEFSWSLSSVESWTRSPNPQGTQCKIWSDSCQEPGVILKAPVSLLLCLPSTFIRRRPLPCCQAAVEQNTKGPIPSSAPP